ncbi:hypothetical protein F5J12DRAFT_308007 [Pisolithus orientalis]|uniref:uncharacterized protein n=1 Tax=Pisolithus orientalis TaxID=936130 RepID=UPI002225A8E7|nr:uncharacterized protein F5J12DRAFT_308007 [Pisolithus orientalis]KAI6030764.1 hypothetical protein F5J12DRAFT_308007 [Pisolithus orientalis]
MLLLFVEPTTSLLASRTKILISFKEFMASISSNALPTQVCRRIVQWTRRSGQAVLCLTCEALQQEAEVTMYEIIMSGNIQITFRVSQTVLSRFRLGFCIFSFSIFQDGGSCQRVLTGDLCSVIQLVLSKMALYSVSSFTTPPTVMVGYWVVYPTFPSNSRKPGSSFTQILTLSGFWKAKFEVGSLPEL